MLKTTILIVFISIIELTTFSQTHTGGKLVIKAQLNSVPIFMNIFSNVYNTTSIEPGNPSILNVRPNFFKSSFNLSVGTTSLNSRFQYSVGINYVPLTLYSSRYEKQNSSSSYLVLNNIKGNYFGLTAKLNGFAKTTHRGLYFGFILGAGYASINPNSIIKYGEVDFSHSDYFNKVYEIEELFTDTLSFGGEVIDAHLKFDFGISIPVNDHLSFTISTNIPILRIFMFNNDIKLGAFINHINFADLDINSRINNINSNNSDGLNENIDFSLKKQMLPQLISV